MAKLYFKVASDWEEVVKLRNEIAKLKQELKSMDSTQSPAAFKALNTQLSASTQRMDELVNEAAKAGAVMEGGFKKKIFDASQTVNGFTERIITQKAVVKDIEADVRRLGDAYRTALKRNPLSASGKLEEYNAARKALDEERAALFGLTQEQANARLSVKKLRDEYALYNNDGNKVVETNEGIAISWKKALTVIGGIGALKALGSEIIRVRGEFQSMQTAIETMVGKDVAGKLIPQIKEMAKVSPLTLTDFVSAEKMMLGFNIEADKTVRYLQALSDISMGDSQKFNSLTLAFSQMSAAGKLMGQDLNQMINAGFNPLQTMSEKTGKSIATLKDEMSKGAISAEMVQQAFIDATSAGGKFYNMSENASKTINGQLSMMQDAMDAAFDEMGQKSEGVIMKGIEMTTSLIQNYETVGKILAGLVVTYGTYKAVMFTVMVIEQARAKTLWSTISATKALTVAQAALNTVMKANPYVLAATALIGLGAAMWTFHDSATEGEKAQRRFNEQQEEAKRQEEEHKQKIDSLVQSSRDIALSDLQRGQSLAELRKEYPKIFAQYDVETIKLADILKLKQQIAEEDAKRAGEKQAKDFSNIESEIKYYENLLKSLSGQQGVDGYVKKLKELRAMRDVMLQDKGKGISEQFISNLNNVDVNEFDRYISELERRIKGKGDNGTIKLRLPIDVKGTLSDEAIYNIKDIKTLIDTAKSAKQTRIDSEKNRTTYKQDYDKAQKEWEDAKKKLSEIEKDKSKFTSKQYEEAKNDAETKEKAYKELGGITGSSLTKQENQAKKQLEKQEKLSEQLLSLRRKNQQDEINLMADGTDKKLAQIDLDYRKELDAIRKQEQEWSKTNGGKLTEEQSVQISLSYSQAESKRDKSISDVNKEELEAMNRYLKEYGTFQQKKEAITKEYNEKIAKATTEGDKKILQKEMEEALSSVDMDKLKQEINWELIFSDLSKVSKKSLEQVKQQLKAFKSSGEYKNMAVDQKKVIDEALNNIQSTIIDKGGLLGDLPEQLDALRIAQEELKQAQDEYNKALKTGTDAEKEAALKKKNNAEKNVQNTETNVTKSADKTKQNLITLADTITQLGSSSEMSLSQIGNLASGLVDVFSEAGSKLGGIIGAAFSLLDGIEKQGLDGFVENVFSSVFRAGASMWDTITFGAFSKITGSGESDKNLEKDLEYLAQSNQDLKNSLDNLSEKMDKASVADASDIYAVQKKNIETLEANTREAMQRSAAAYNNGFLGIGGSHSSGSKIDKGMSTSEWKRVSDIVGQSISSAGQFFRLSSEQMAKLAEEDTSLYSKIKDLANNGYKDAAQYMDEYITYYKQLEELENAYNEKLTNTSFDSIRSDFKNALLDMESDAEDFADNFEKMMQNAIVESLMTKKYDKLLQEWYSDFAKAMEGDGKISENEQISLKRQWENITKQAIAERDALKEVMGWESESESTSQSSTSKGFGTEMTHEDAGELSGRFTALQITGEEIKNQSITQSQSLNLLTVKIDTILSINTEAKNIADDTRDLIAQSYLELVEISENTGNSAKYLKDIKADIAEVKKNTSKL